MKSHNVLQRVRAGAQNQSNPSAQAAAAPASAAAAHTHTAAAPQIRAHHSRPSGATQKLLTGASIPCTLPSGSGTPSGVYLSIPLRDWGASVATSTVPPGSAARPQTRERETPETSPPPAQHVAEEAELVLVMCPLIFDIDIFPVVSFRRAHPHRPGSPAPYRTGARCASRGGPSF